MPSESPARKDAQQTALLFATFVIAICGLVYELLAGTLSSYLLGDSIYQFSLVIGLFMSSMGIGAWLSRYVDKELPANFVRLQFYIGLLGGLIAPILFFAFAVLFNYTPLLFVLIILLGAMLGIEIPLIIRILKTHLSLKLNVSNVFTADYIGALVAALLFPLVLIPQLGLLQTGFLFGLLNIGVGAMALYIFRDVISKPHLKWMQALFFGFIMLAGMVFSENYTSNIERRLFQDDIIFAKSSSHQRLVLTQRKKRLRFYINGALQFDSYDEYRYHETLVHPAMSLLHHPEQVLVLGGGDGLAVRELLRYDTIKNITLVDLDPAVTALFSQNKRLQQLNQQSLKDDKVKIVNQDAWKFLEKNTQLFDLVLIDLPDPNNASLSRLYSNSFYKLLKQSISQQGIIVTQATSPLYSRKAFWSIEKTLSLTENNEDWYTLPYHSYIPSFGEWGFIMASRRKIRPETIQLKKTFRYLSPDVLPSLFEFPQDMAKLEVEANHISSHPLLQYYLSGWSYWYQ